MSEEDYNIEGEKPTNPMGANPDTVQLLYFLLIPAAFLCGVSAVIAVVIAYLSKVYAPEWLQTHYEFLINTFWKGALYLAISFVLMFVIIGFFTAILGTIWWIVRLFKGLKLLMQKEPIPDPSTWWL